MVLSILQPPRTGPTNQQSFPPHTPGRVANRLLSRLNPQALMASPGPRLRDESDNESGEDEENVVGQHISLIVPPAKIHRLL